MEVLAVCPKKADGGIVSYFLYVDFDYCSSH